MDGEGHWIVAAVLKPSAHAGVITAAELREELGPGGFEVDPFPPGGFVLREHVDAMTPTSARDAFFTDLVSEPVGSLLEIVAVSVRDAEQPLRGRAERALFRGFPRYDEWTSGAKPRRHRSGQHAHPHLRPHRRST
jgi:hypothetical protein